MHLLHKRGPRVLLLLPVGVKFGAENIVADLQLPHAEPKDAAGFLASILRIIAVIAE
jgi:hypothetical protein